MNRNSVWSKNFTLLIGASALGSAGSILAGFALAFLVFKETDSTLASAFVLTMKLFPSFLLPLIAGPVMDRMPRKLFLCVCDLISSVVLLIMGWIFLSTSFSYVVYLFFSLILSSLEVVDELSYSSIMPACIPKGHESQGYSVAGMLYPVEQMILIPIAAFVYDSIGVGWILILQAVCSMLACIIESRIQVDSQQMKGIRSYSFTEWKNDLKEAADYMKKEPGLLSFYSYAAITNGIARGYSPLLVAFFSSTPGFTPAMYSFFTAFEFAGRSVGGTIRYVKDIPKNKLYHRIVNTFLVYETMDAILLYLPYPLMLANRTLCGFLGISSATLREAALQRYIPETLRARINAFKQLLFNVSCSILPVFVGFLGEVMSYQLAMFISALITLIALYCTVIYHRRSCQEIFLSLDESSAKA